MSKPTLPKVTGKKLLRHLVEYHGDDPRHGVLRVRVGGARYTEYVEAHERGHKVFGLLRSHRHR